MFGIGVGIGEYLSRVSPYGRITSTPSLAWLLSLFNSLANIQGTSQIWTQGNAMGEMELPEHIVLGTGDLDKRLLDLSPRTLSLIASARSCYDR